MDYPIKILLQLLLCGSVWIASPRIIPAQIPVSVEFGEPTRACLGRGQICTIEVRDWAQGPSVATAIPGVLQSIKGGWELHFYSGRSDSLSIQEWLPVGYCDLMAPLWIHLGNEPDAIQKKTEIVVPPGRYRLYREEGDYILRF